jgi:hemoglobin
MSEDEGKQTLYERVGGEETIEHLVGAFYVRVLADTELEPFFRDTSMEKQRRMQRVFFAVALGGPIEYTGRPLGDAHRGLGITTEHMTRFVGHLLDTLKGVGVDEADTDEIIARINTYADDILSGGALGIDA